VFFLSGLFFVVVVAVVAGFISIQSMNKTLLNKRNQFTWNMLLSERPENQRQ